jgi:DNA-binding NarL/FixJ family response regulator
VKRSVTMREHRRILIVDADETFRDELHNFLLSAGYRMVDSAVDHEDALLKLEERSYDVIMLDAGPPAGAVREFADKIVRRSPRTRVVLMAGRDFRPEESRGAIDRYECETLLKVAFARDVLYLLERNTDPGSSPNPPPLREPGTDTPRGR